MGLCRGVYIGNTYIYIRIMENGNYYLGSRV